MTKISFFAGRRAVLLTKHKKEEVIKPVLEKGTGCQIIVEKDYDTDQLGTFTREIARLGSQLEAARNKARKGMELKGTDLGIASEGSFGPYPGLPFLPLNREIVLLVDACEKLEICGVCQNSNTNFASEVAANFEQAENFAHKTMFPSHFLVLRPDHEEHSTVIKGINNWEWLREAISWTLAKSVTGKVFLETDMRAYANPTRMQNIKKAAEDLVDKINSRCPHCQTPGYVAVESNKGLPCEECGLPTREAAAFIFACQMCGSREERLVPEKTAPAARCDYCNP
ncbi:MAG: hypothetical protein KGZ96_13455 [Clostridia bacterium]|jgi:hypothetical protein|nr:hypothetical protein [Clostridia bacterium]